MTDKQFKLSIVTPDKVFFEQNAEMIIITTTEGEMGILKSHEPVTAVLKIKAIDIISNGERKSAFVAGGFVEVKPDKVRIITDSAEWPEEIDVERATKARERATKRLGSDKHYNSERVQFALERAEARLALLEKIKSN
ncbi:MAG: ATP synthase F1 subunit epsilon [Clostridia bacterium]|jgi:F-type H+-transporting ATPase subunit epsilon|nr:ATP synthase F1 subunit epsilon [Clostridia bacterium]